MTALQTAAIVVLIQVGWLLSGFGGFRLADPNDAPGGRMTAVLGGLCICAAVVLAGVA